MFATRLREIRLSIYIIETVDTNMSLPPSYYHDFSIEICYVDQELRTEHEVYS